MAISFYFVGFIGHVTKLPTLISSYAAAASVNGILSLATGYRGDPRPTQAQIAEMVTLEFETILRAA
jgi:hypothetical protein